MAQHARTVNQLRGLLTEFGVVVPQGVATFKARWAGVRQRDADEVPRLAWDELDTLYQRLLSLHQQILAFEVSARPFKAMTAPQLMAQKKVETTPVVVVRYSPENTVPTVWVARQGRQSKGRGSLIAR